MSRTLPALAAVVVLAGCAATDGPYPSLALRPAEKHGFEEPATPSPAPAAADPALDAKVAEVERTRAAAASAFDTAAARAEKLAQAARGAVAGSEPWLDAQTALAELDAARAKHQDSLGVLEDMAAARAQALQPAYPALERALAAARDAAAAQTQRIDAIAARLAPA